MEIVAFPFTDGQMEACFLSHLPIIDYPLCSKYWARVFMAYKDVQGKVLVLSKNAVIGLG